MTVAPDADQVRAPCERVPQARARIAELLDRIQGDEDVAGSAAALSARADRARAAGRDAAADRLESRAERRTARVDDLHEVDDRLAKAQEAVCVPLDEQLGTDA